MDITNGLKLGLKQILSKLKLLNVIRSYTLKIDFGRIEEDLKDCLIEVNGLLGKCVKKIGSKPRRAEIRNVIGVLVRKKNIKRLKATQTECEVVAVSEQKEKECQRLASEEKYLCEFCGIKFFNYLTLKVHIQKIHKCVRLKLKNNDGIGGDEAEDASKQNLEGTIDVNRGEGNASANEQPEVGCGKLDVTEDNDGKTGNDNAESLQCPHRGCKRNFRHRSSLKKHIRLKHGAKIEYRCSKCEKVFFEKGKLNRHILTHEGGQYQCLKCHRIFHRMDNLRRHITSHLENVKAFKCRFCPKSFSLKCNRNSHETNVHDNTGMQCEFCGKKCKNEATLKIHMKLHEGKRICCSLCSKTFTRKAQYRNHLKIKHEGLSPFQKLFDSFATSGATS